MRKVMIFVAIVCLVAPISCSAEPEFVEVETVEPCSVQSKEYFFQVSLALGREASVTTELLYKGDREVLVQLEKIREDANDLEYPPCAHEVRDLLDEYLSLMYDLSVAALDGDEVTANRLIDDLVEIKGQLEEKQDQIQRDEEVAASAEAQMTMAQKQTEEARPTATSSPTSNEEEKAHSISAGEDGWQNYLYEEDGFSVSLPPHWSHLDLGTDDIDEMLSLAGDVNPEIGNLFTTEYISNLVASGIKLVALDTSPDSLGSGIPTGVNVLVLDIPFDIAFDDYIEANVMQLKGLYGEDLVLSQQTRLLGGIKAGKLVYQMEMNDVFGQAHIVTCQQYLMLDGRTQYVLTFLATEDQFSQNEEIFSIISQSFEPIK